MLTLLLNRDQMCLQDFACCLLVVVIDKMELFDRRHKFTVDYALLIWLFITDLKKVKRELISQAVNGIEMIK